MQTPKRGGKQAKQASQVGGLSPAHFEIALSSAKDSCLGFIRDLTAQLPNEMLPYLPRISALVSFLHLENLRNS
jgi:hypothetical protein